MLTGMSSLWLMNRLVNITRHVFVDVRDEDGSDNSDGSESNTTQINDLESMSVGSLDGLRECTKDGGIDSGYFVECGRSPDSHGTEQSCDTGGRKSCAFNSWDNFLRKEGGEFVAVDAHIDADGDGSRDRSSGSEEALCGADVIWGDDQAGDSDGDQLDPADEKTCHSCELIMLA